MIKTRGIHCIFEIEKAKYLFAFSIGTCLVSLYYQNWIGVLCALGFNFLFVFILYVRLMLTRSLLEESFKLVCLFSILAAIVALGQYISILHRHGYSFFSFKVFDKPYDRATGFAFNANYYAMMIEFVLMICFYRLLEVKGKRCLFYLLTIAANLAGLYFSGCRSAWVPILLALPCTFLINRQKKLCLLTLGILILGVGIVLTHPHLIPRIETLAYHIGKRGWIWQTAIEGIKHHPLLGQGPFTYMFSYQQYQGPYTQHAHSLYLEPLLSYGIILTGVFLTYMVSNIKQCFHLYHQDRHLFSLVFSFMMVVICHGVFDYTIFWIQTILLFFIVLASGDLKGVKVVQVDA